MNHSRDFFTIDDFDLRGKTVLLRADINSPMDPVSGRILDDTRMRRHIPTINDLKSGKTAILAHQSKPGKKDFTNLSKHAEQLTQLLGRGVKYVDSLFDEKALNAIQQMKNGDIILLENTRFFAEELVLKNAKPEILAKTHLVTRLSSVADYYVNDAFAATHRAQSSLIGFGEVMPAMAGRLMERELTMLGKALGAGGNTTAIFGGAKVDDSIEVMGHMLESGVANKILTGGLVASIFIKAQGIELGKGSQDAIGKEVPEPEKMISTASALLSKYGDMILVPTDVALNDNGIRSGTRVSELPSQHPIYDIGLDTIVKYIEIIKNSDNVILNGPMGVFELEEFSFGTLEIFKALADTKAFTVVGGGHTATVVSQLGLEDRIDHVSTGGGALITMLSGKTLPVVEMLKRSKIKFDKK